MSRRGDETFFVLRVTRRRVLDYAEEFGTSTMREVPDLVAEMRALLQGLEAAGVEYALCGGLAANIYGADRFTKDIDLLVAPDDLDAALAVAQACGFTMDSGEIPVLEGLHRMRRVVKLVEGWEEPLPLDLMLAEGGTYARALAARRAIEHEDGEIWLTGKDELVAMKREAGRPIDRQDIERMS